jgi:hypothetical protein
MKIRVSKLRPICRTDVERYRTVQPRWQATMRAQAIFATAGSDYQTSEF